MPKMVINKLVSHPGLVTLVALVTAAAAITKRVEVAPSWASWQGEPHWLVALALLVAMVVVGVAREGRQRPSYSRPTSRSKLCRPRLLVWNSGWCSDFPQLVFNCSKVPQSLPAADCGRLLVECAGPHDDTLDVQMELYMMELPPSSFWSSMIIRIVSKLLRAASLKTLCHRTLCRFFWNK